MKLTKISDFILVQWYSMLDVTSAVSDSAYRSQSARVTGNRIKALTRGAYSKVVSSFDFLPTEEFLPVGEHYLGENDDVLLELPSLHHFRSVVEAETLIVGSSNSEKPLSQISQYRLAAYVAGLQAS